MSSINIKKNGITKEDCILLATEDEAVDNLKCWTADLASAGELAGVCVMPGLQDGGLGRKMMKRNYEIE